MKVAVSLDHGADVSFRGENWSVNLQAGGLAQLIENEIIDQLKKHHMFPVWADKIKMSGDVPAKKEAEKPQASK